MLDNKRKAKNFRDIKQSIMVHNRTTAHINNYDLPIVPNLQLQTSVNNRDPATQEKLSFKLLQTQRNQADSGLPSNYFTNPNIQKQKCFVSPSKNTPLSINANPIQNIDLSSNKKKLMYYRPSNYQGMLLSKQCSNKENSSSNIRDASKNSNKSDGSDTKGKMMFAGLANVAAFNKVSNKNVLQEVVRVNPTQNLSQNKKGQFSRFSKLAQCTSNTSREKDIARLQRNLEVNIVTTKVSTTPPKLMFSKNRNDDLTVGEPVERPKTPPPRIIKDQYVKQHALPVVMEQVIVMKPKQSEESCISKMRISGLEPQPKGRKESVQSELDQVNVSRSIDDSELDMNPYF